MRTIFIHPTSETRRTGRTYVAVLDGKVIDEHYCSNDEFAKADLGFYESNNCPENSRLFNKKRREKYQELCPQGFCVEFRDSIFE